MNIKNPANESTGYKALRRYQGQNGAGIKAREYIASIGYDGVNNEDQEFIAFESNQIKSATDNVGSFDPSNNDIRFRFIGEKGARNLDKAEEATTRLDNLAVAREMEAAFNAKKERIGKLKDSKPIVAEWKDYEGQYNLDNKSAADYIKDTLRGEYTNKDTGRPIKITRKGAFKVTRHDAENDVHLKSIALIPQMIEESIFIEELPNLKGGTGFDSYRYYVVGLNLDGVDYTAKLAVGTKNGETYYDHSLTEIEKTSLIERRDEISSSFTNNEAVNPYHKDKRLISILQTNDKENAKKIKMATGWERGADGLWRYEVDDNIDFELRRPKKDELKKAYDEASEKYHKLEMRIPLRTPKSATEEEKQRIKEMRKGLAKLRKAMNKAFEAYYDYSAESATLGEFLGKDNQLFKEYPELADYAISFVRDSKKLAEGLKGSFTPEYQTIWLDDNRPKGDIKSSLIHEIQHAIQGIEGFAHGGTPAAFASAKYQAESWKKDFNEFINRYGFEDWEKNLPFEELMKYGKQYKGQFGGLHRAFIDNAIEDEDVKKTLTKELDYVKAAYDKFYQTAGGMDVAYKFKDANEWYRSLSGEVESRNVQQRMGMTDEQRRASLASETEDVAREDQIFLKDGVESGMRFRISEKAKQIQEEVDKFASKYNSKPVVLVDSEMTDEELFEAFPFEKPSETRLEIEEGYLGGYNHRTGKIYIFADKQSLENLEDTLFHENIHGMFVDDKRFIEDFNKNSQGRFPLNRKQIKDEGYSESEVPEELFARLMGQAMNSGDFHKIKNYLSEDLFNELLDKLKTFGYEYEQESDSRRGESVGPGTTGILEGQEVSEKEGLAENGRQESAVDPRERKARLTELFNKVADMGLQGVLGNKEYDRLMMDIYSVLPKDAREEITRDTFKHYGTNFVPAVSDYIGAKADGSIMDKIVSIIREALRKVGFDLDLNANEVKYLAWRSKKPLNRGNLLDVAEDIGMQYRLKVGEYDGTRFSVKKKAELIQDVRDLKDEVRGLKDEVSDQKKQVRELRKGSKDEWETKQRAIISFVKGRLTKEAGDMLGKARIEQILTLVTKASNSTELYKPLQFIEQVINSAAIDSAAAKMDKLIKTKLQSETSRGVAKGVVVDEATRRLFDSIRGTFKDLLSTSIDSELRHVRGEILRFGKEVNALPEDDRQGRAILTARQDAMKERRKELEAEQEDLRKLFPTMQSY